jgi:beta-lactamase class D
MASILTRRRALGLWVAGLVSVPMPRSALAGDTVDRSDLGGLFTEQGASGTFALYDAEADRFTLVDPRRAATRFVPASTFKIPNSLIALETGVVKDEEEVIPYGGKPQPIKGWERDMGMREAIAMSNVPIYQEIARRVGLERYRAWLERLDYGNRQTGAVVDRFWLDGPLEISAMEQARFAARLAKGSLPATERSQSIVRSILKVESSGSRTLYAKTGWWASGTPKLGWWTGWVDNGGKIAAFSLNMDMPTAADGQKRISVGKAILARLGVL